MKPKNKLQKRVLTLSKKLSPITQAQARWGYRNCIEHIGRRTKKGVISCLECAHSWTDKTARQQCTCPNCNTKLKIHDTRQRVFNDYQYLCIFTACEEFQVLRFIYIDYRAKAGEKARYFHSEVVQRWIESDGKCTSLARLRPMGYFVNSWSFGSPLEIRPDKNLYNIPPTKVYPRQKLIPKLQRSGFKGRFYDITPSDLFIYLLTENKGETLLKAGQIELLQFFSFHTSKKIDPYWASIKIAMRNNYCIEDVELWCDYIDLLCSFRKDLHSPKYVCPDDFKAEHDRYVKKRREQLERERKEEDKAKALENEAEFLELKARFFGICFSDELIQVRVMESVEEIMLEGDTMHHCVFTNNYHLKPDSLILSACIDGKKIETIEVSLSKLTVIQSRGKRNQNSEYHDRIVKLVNKNIALIQQRLSA